MRVEAFSVKRTYSSSPSRRCAFSIGLVLLFRWSLGQPERPPIRIDQPQLVGPALAMVHDLGVAFLFDEGRDVFHRSPAGNMPVASFSEDAIQQAGSTEQSHMTAVKRCDRPPCRNIVIRQEQWRHLLPGQRVRERIFEEIIGKAPVGECGFTGTRYRIWWANARLQFRHLLEAGIETYVLKLSLVLFECRAPNVVTNAQNNNLPVLNGLRIGHTKHVHRGEV